MTPLFKRSALNQGKSVPGTRCVPFADHGPHLPSDLIRPRSRCATGAKDKKPRGEPRVLSNNISRPPPPSVRRDRQQQSGHELVIWSSDCRRGPRIL